MNRFPYHTTSVVGNVRRYIRLFKRRHKCLTCGHRHGPNKNNSAKACTTCACEHMLDWLPVFPSVKEPL